MLVEKQRLEVTSCLLLYHIQHLGEPLYGHLDSLTIQQLAQLSKRRLHN